MKKILALVSLLLVAAACTNQPSTNTNMGSNANTATPKSAAPSEADLVAKEKSAWDTLKQKDYAAFGNLLASDYVEVTSEGVFDKTGIVADVKDFNLTDATFSDWKMLPIDNDAAILTYNTTLKATYKGQAVPPGPYHSAAAWVNRDGKWLSFYYQQTLVTTAPPPPAGAAKSDKATASPTVQAAATGSDPIANEKIVWDAFRNRNYDLFASLLDPAFVELESNAVYDKAAAVKGADFDATQFDLTEWKAGKLDNDAALVTYLVKSKDPKMGDQRHTTIWASRGGKWLALLHIGTAVSKPMSNSEMKKM
ncbi:MAG: hypothetical protein QOH70_264 [Blastocatellia bacterium]|jgi:hypothetical protein|nr:hypothetical protein [Blastocatellia bacterium]